MIKPAIVALLVFLCLLLVKANIDTFRTTPMAEETESTLEKKTSTKKISPLQPLTLNPSVSPQVPDLSNGYLFNAQRFLAKDARPSNADKGTGQNIRPDDVVFNGALLGEGYKKALVSYTLGTKQEIRPGRPGPKSQDNRRQGTLQLGVGDQLGGYTVKEISADFILFMKGSDTIKKTLFDPAKERQPAAPRPPSAAPSPQTHQGIAQPRRIAPVPVPVPVPVPPPAQNP
ncbi:MAG: hypothetical protein KKD73_04480 [Proteobacteria bacterium]|nr:hypothetical protein [Pseudomonadota bacterium]MBU1639622.1 hypothetical protein [Pseudomonadota bacterium]